MGASLRRADSRQALIELGVVCVGGRGSEELAVVRAWPGIFDVCVVFVYCVSSLWLFRTASASIGSAFFGLALSS